MTTLNYDNINGKQIVSITSTSATLLRCVQTMTMFIEIIVILILIIIIILSWTYCKLSIGICIYNGHLVGKVVIVTGANTGIGFETAKDLARRGAFVILACRNLAKGSNAKQEIIKASGNKEIHLLLLDLSSFASIRTFVDEVCKLTQRLDILINNAGAFKTENEYTEDGLLTEMQINYFGPFLLTRLLLPLLKQSAPSRIINVSSISYMFGSIDLNTLTKNNHRRIMSTTLRDGLNYCKSKLCIMLMTTELARSLQGTGVTANCLHPGIVSTQIIDQVMCLVRWILRVLQSFNKTPWEGAQTTIYLAVSPDVENINGAYFADCQMKSLTSTAQDLNLARKLWEVSEKIVKLK